jgi:hypothetical protein
VVYIYYDPLNSEMKRKWGRDRGERPESECCIYGQLVSDKCLILEFRSMRHSLFLLCFGGLAVNLIPVAIFGILQNLCFYFWLVNNEHNPQFTLYFSKPILAHLNSIQLVTIWINQIDYKKSNIDLTATTFKLITLYNVTTFTCMYRHIMYAWLYLF